MPEKELVQLFDVVLSERDVPPRREHQVHQLGVAGHSLFVARGTRVSKDLISRFDSSCSTSRSDNLLPSMRVDEPMLSMVATRRRADSRSGASVPRARQAPLNSSILAMRFRISGVIWMVSVRSTNQYFTHLHPF